MKRRQLLAGLGSASLTGLGGCLSMFRDEDCADFANGEVSFESRKEQGSYTVTVRAEAIAGGTKRLVVERPSGDTRELTRPEEELELTGLTEGDMLLVHGDTGCQLMLLKSHVVAEKESVEEPEIEPHEDADGSSDESVEVEFSQSRRESATEEGLYDVEVQLVMTGGADAVIVVADGRDVDDMVEAGESITVEGLNPGDRVFVDAAYSQDREMVATYTVDG